MNEQTKLPRVAVVGLGGIGLGVAAALAESGRARVIGCARRPLASASLERDGETTTIDLELADDPRGLGPVEWVVVATKVHQTEGARPWLDALCDERTRIVVMQNGIHRDRAIADLAPRARAVVPSVVYFSGEPLAAGVARFRHVRDADAIVPDSSDAAEFCALLAPFFRARVDARFDSAAWQKLLLNVAANSVTALTLRRTDVFREPAIAALASGLMDEAARVARADGTPLASDVVATMLGVLQAYPEGIVTSMYVDRLAGRPTEIDAFNGAVVELGRRYDIPCPINAAVAALVGASAPPHIAR